MTTQRRMSCARLLDEFKQGTADSLPDEQHNTSTTPEKKHFKAEEVDSPEITPLTEFLTTPSQKKVDDEGKKKVDDKEDNDGVFDVWEQNEKSATAGFGVYSIAEAWE